MGPLQFNHLPLTQATSEVLAYLLWCNLIVLLFVQMQDPLQRQDQRTVNMKPGRLSLHGHRRFHPPNRRDTPRDSKYAEQSQQSILVVRPLFPLDLATENRISFKVLELMR